MHHLELDTIVLHAGSHPTRSAGVCLLEAVAWWADEDHTDRPTCVDPTLAAFGRSWNDGMRTDEERAQLVPYVPVLVGTVGTADDSARRAWMALDWSVRVSTPAWLDLAGLADHAQRLRGLPEIDRSNCSDDVDDPESRAEREMIRAALSAARSAAYAARAAAGAAARAAARDVLEPTVERLQPSAHLLLRRMIAAGPHNPAALTALPEVA